jgi:uncharacterized protein YoxC
METARNVLEIVALGAVSALCIYLIVVLSSVRRLLESLQHDLRAMSTKALPVLDNLGVITDHFRTVAETVSEQVDSIRNSIDAFKKVAEDIIDLERRIQERIEEPLLDMVETIASLFRNVQSLMDRIPFIGRSRAQ